MSTSRRALPLIVITVIAFGSLALELAQGWSPALGLDLQGGISVVYQATDIDPDAPTSTTTTTTPSTTSTTTTAPGATTTSGPETTTSSTTTTSTTTTTTAPADATTSTTTPEEAVDRDQALDDAIEIIRSRVDSLGVAEPEILRQGDAIVVNLPGVADRERALSLIGRTAELRFRPVLSIQPFVTADQLEPADGSTTTTVPTGSTTTAPGATSTSTSTTLAPSTTEGAVGLAPGEIAAALPVQDTTTTTTAPATTTTTAAPGATTTTSIPGDLPTDDGCFLLGGTTDRAADDPTATVILPGIDSRQDEDDQPEFCYQLGPVPADGTRSLVGSIVSGPEAQINSGEWGVSLTIDGDALPLFNTVATECYLGSATCPSQGTGQQGRLAIVLDGEVQSAPSINEPSFSSDGLSISGNFTEAQARDLALVLRYGALPIELEAQTVQTVSATLGEDSLRAGLIAGLLGIGLVFLYLFVYYRALGVVVVLGTAVWSALNYAVIAWLGETQGLALSLAGVTGIVISVGVTVDAYIVYFERLKDELRSGRTVRSSIDRGFQRAFRTILAANVSSFIGAFFLYILTVGPVRGFAFFLGLSTVLGVIVAWFFTRPLMALLGRSHLFTDHPILGVGRGLGVAQVAAAGDSGGKAAR